MNTITPQSLTLIDSSGNTRTGNSEKLIPAGGTLQATVRQVAQDQLSPNVFRLKLEANSVLMELKVQQPIPQGSQITLSRSATGQLSVTISSQGTSKTNASNTPDKPQNSRTYQTTAIPVIRTTNDTSRLNRLIPGGQSINALVITQTTSQTILTPQAVTTQISGPLPTPTQSHTPLPQPAQPPLLTTNTPLQTATTTSQTASAQAAIQTTVASPPLPTSTHTSSPNTQTAPSPQQPTAPTSQPAQTPPTTNQTPTTPAPSVGQPPTTTHINTTPPPHTPSASQALSQPTGTKYNADLAANIMTLKIRGETVALKTSANLPPLQQVQVSRGTTDQFLIRWSQPISPPSTAAAPLTEAQAKTIENSMRELLPQQITLTNGVQQLLNSTQSSNANAAGQIDKVVQSLMLLFGVKPGATEARHAIKQNVNYGGLFTENKLANNQAPPKDMKQFLGKMQVLAEQLPDTQKQIIQTTIEKMLARITTNQLHSLQHRQDRTETNERFFQLDLPVQNHNQLENVEMRISQRSQKNSRDEAETIWKIRLHFDLEETGSIDAELSLNQERNEISASFTCANNDTATFVRNQLDSFKTQLTALGLQVPALTCKQGAQRQQHSPIQKQLIDIKT